MGLFLELATFCTKFECPKKNSKNRPPFHSFRDPKNHQKSTRAELLGVSDGVLKTDPRPGLQKMRFCCYLLYLKLVGRLQKRPSLGTILGTRLVKNTKKGGSEKTPKNISKKTPKWTPKLDNLGVISRRTSKQFGIWGPWPHLGPAWFHFGFIFQ